MAEHPIIFSTDMVKAILDGQKTQTRRIVKDIHLDYIEQTNITHWCPYGQVGDRLWVRETFAYYPDEEHIIFKAREGKELAVLDVDLMGCWKPSIHMPRWAARIFLEITNIRVERVKDITLADIKAEGLPIDRKFEETKTAWIDLWNSLNDKRGYGWDKNPWVWVIEWKQYPV